MRHGPCTSYRGLCTSYTGFCTSYTLWRTSYSAFCTSYTRLCTSYSTAPMIGRGRAETGVLDGHLPELPVCGNAVHPSNVGGRRHVPSSLLKCGLQIPEGSGRRTLPLRPERSRQRQDVLRRHGPGQSKGNQPSHDLLHLPNLARIRVAPHQSSSPNAQLEPDPTLCASALDEMIQERFDVFDPLDQGRKDENPRVHAVEEVPSDRSALQAGLKARIGRSHDLASKGPGLRRPHSTEDPLLKDLKEVLLHANGHAADLVHEERARADPLQIAHSVTVGAGEGSLHMTKELARRRWRRRALGLRGTRS